MREHPGIGDEEVRLRLCHCCGDDVAGANALVDAADRMKVHQPAVAGPAGHAMRLGVLLPTIGLDEKFYLCVHQFLVFFQAHALLQGDEPLVAFLHYFLGDLLLVFGGGCAGTRRILEGEGASKAGFFHHVEGGLKVFLSLAGEAHDNVRGDGRVRDFLPHFVKDGQEFLGPV